MDSWPLRYTSAWRCRSDCQEGHESCWRCSYLRTFVWQPTCKNIIHNYDLVPNVRINHQFPVDRYWAISYMRLLLAICTNRHNSSSYCTQCYASYIAYKFSISQLCILTWKTARTITQRPTDLIDNVNKHHRKVQYIDLSAICTRALCISCLFSPCIYQACALTLYLHPTDIKITTLRGISIRNIFYLCSMQERDRPK